MIWADVAEINAQPVEATMKIKAVTEVITMNTAGQVVESRPVREVFGPVLDTAGQWVSPVAVEESPDGIPVRFVTDAVVLNSVGQPVAAAPVTGGAYSPEATLGAYLIDMLDPRRLDLMTIDGSNRVASLTSSKLGKVFVQASNTEKPVLASFASGRPAFAFDGTDDSMTFEGNVGWPSGADGVLVLTRLNNLAGTAGADPGNRSLLCWGSAAATGRYDLRRVTPAGNHRAGFGVGLGASSMGAVNAADFAGLHTSTALADGANASVTVDGVTGPVLAAIPSIGVVRARFGANSAAVQSAFWNGLSGPVLVCDPATPAPLIAQAQAWLDAY